MRSRTHTYSSLFHWYLFLSSLAYLLPTITIPYFITSSFTHTQLEPSPLLTYGPPTLRSGHRRHRLFSRTSSRSESPVLKGYLPYSILLFQVTIFSFVAFVWIQLRRRVFSHLLSSFLQSFLVFGVQCQVLNPILVCFTVSCFFRVSI